MGTIYSRPHSKFLWVKYYQDGRPVYESTGTTKEAEAKRFLKIREGAQAKGEPIAPRLDRILYDEARADLLASYEATGSRDLAEAGCRLAHLDKAFKGRPLAKIAPGDADAYTKKRRGEGAADGTIRRELSTLTTMLNLAAERGKLARVPKLRKPPDGKPRQGFLDPDQAAAVARHLAPDLQVATAIGYTLGWRVQEVLTRERRHLDLDAGTLRLGQDETKSGQPRVAYLPPHLAGLLRDHLDRVGALEQAIGRLVPFLFPHFTGGRRHQAGDQRSDWRKAWVTACTKAGVPGTLRHDMRRSAVRNMVTVQGIPEHVAMKITGHETRRVFDAYNIVSPAELQDAARKMGAPGPMVTLAVTPGPEVEESRPVTT
jgi:integrase